MWTSPPTWAKCCGRCDKTVPAPSGSRRWRAIRRTTLYTLKRLGGGSVTQAVSAGCCCWLVSSATAWLAGCSTPPRSTVDAGSQFWSGRMALQLQDDSVLNSNGPQSFSASFELRGLPQAGSLQLFTPLGSSVALISWQPGSALLQQGQTQRTSASLDELVRDTPGHPHSRARPVCLAAGPEPGSRRLERGT